jgi:hypothetical protein
MRKKGRPILGAFAGFFLGLFVAIDLLIFSVIQLDSIVVIILPILGLVLGIALPLIARKRANRPQEMREPALDPYVPPPIEEPPTTETPPVVIVDETPPPVIEEVAAPEPPPTEEPPSAV